MSSWIRTAKRQHDAETERAGTRPGYYLVLPDGSRHFVSSDVNEAALNRLCDKYLTQGTGWNYWIDYLYGLDVFGDPAWSNVDHTDRFI